ncbi:MAG: neutral/alkaline non-lysosomal ceramidase N-terminal domain-containing protein [Candidatus Hydrogenedentes bacterium]|nr:neutral/alkaline non-lysosomal ceramidase N-terminal domain-containing protein [Candidatus Hydrogenedentota bacterium]
MIKKILIVVLVLVVTLVGLFVTFVFPWPAYSYTDFDGRSYYKTAIRAVEEDAQKSELSSSPGALQAGWGSALLTPKAGTPLAGYGDRKGKSSTGVHDDVYAKALALSDGKDMAVLVGTDLLIVPENVADLVRQKVTSQTSLTPSDILFNASHDHSGPGAWGPGYAAKQFGGTYDEDVMKALADGITTAILDACALLKPAAVAFGSIQVPEHIRNRTRDSGTVDPELSYMVVQREDGRRCYLASYSAHPTVLGGGNMEVSGDYPGYLQRYIEGQTGQFAMYLGGAVGSMGPRAPDGPDGFAKAQAMGESLAKKILAQTDPTKVEPGQASVTPAANPSKVKLNYADHLDIASVGVPIPLPPMQLRVTPSLRMSPLFFRMMGIDSDGWIGGVKVGNAVFAGAPCDLSGELSVELKQWAEKRGVDLWPLSFNGDYVGYISPDKYYGELREPDGSPAYETGLMSWCGPHAGAYFTALIEHVVEAMTPSGA